MYIKYAYFSVNFKVIPCVYKRVLVDMDSLTWGLSISARGRLSWELRVSPEQQGSNPHNQSTREQSKAVEATSPIDTSGRGNLRESFKISSGKTNGNLTADDKTGSSYTCNAPQASPALSVGGPPGPKKIWSSEICAGSRTAVCF